MRCPPEIAAILLSILETGVLQARAAGWSGDAARAALEADHVHNLPGLLTDYSDDRLTYYWETERTAYLTGAGSDSVAAFKQLWEQLRNRVETAVPSPI
jgi:hypothetical protein